MLANLCTSHLSLKSCILKSVFFYKQRAKQVRMRVVFRGSLVFWPVDVRLLSVIMLLCRLHLQCALICIWCWFCKTIVKQCRSSSQYQFSLNKITIINYVFKVFLEKSLTQCAIFLESFNCYSILCKQRKSIFPLVEIGRKVLITACAAVNRNTQTSLCCF